MWMWGGRGGSACDHALAFFSAAKPSRDRQLLHLALSDELVLPMLLYTPTGDWFDKGRMQALIEKLKEVSSGSQCHHSLTDASVPPTEVGPACTCSLGVAYIARWQRERTKERTAEREARTVYLYVTAPRTHAISACFPREAQSAERIAMTASI